MRDNKLNLLDPSKVRFVRVLWCDNGNMIRGKAVHLSRFSSYVKSGIGISEAQQSVPVTVDAPAEGAGLGPVGEVRLVPDLETLTLLPYAPGHARVLGNMVRDGAPWPLCPRNFLRRMIAEAAQDRLELMAAFENEFYLLQPSTGAPSPVDETAFGATLSMDMNRVVIDAIADALIAQGIPVEQYYPESGPGQQEISLGHTDALTAADRQIAFRETVKAIALQHQLKASFAPKIFPDKAGSGCHLHLSLWRNGINLTPSAKKPGALSVIAQSFVAGVLHHLPALMAVTTPSPNSYRRIRPHCWSGAFRCWGFDNREAAVRIPTNAEYPSPTHIELKTVDASSNPHLALGAVIAAGLDGVRRKLQIPEEVSVDPGSMSETERETREIDRLPTLLGDAIAFLERDDVLMEALGPGLAKAYLAVRKAEWETMKYWPPAMEVEALLDRY